MAALIDENTQFVDTGGKPIVNGSLYIGVQGADPEISPATIYSDRALTTVLANPQTLDANGRSTNKVWVADRYSLKVKDSTGSQALIDLDAGESPSSGITSISNVQGTNAITGDASPAIIAYTDTELYVFTAAAANTGAVTLNFGGGAKTLLKHQNQALGSGDIQADQTIVVAYNAGEDNFNMVTAAAVSPWESFSGAPTFVSGTSFTVAGDHTAALHIGRRIRVTDSGGDVFGSILTSAFSSPNTTITVALDSGTIDSGISAIAYGLGPAADSATPGSMMIGPITLTSLSSYSFDVPAWATQATVLLEGVSSNGTNRMNIRLGSSLGVESTGYDGSGMTLSATNTAFDLDTAIFIANAEADVDVFSGQVCFELCDRALHKWTYSGTIADEPAEHVNVLAGVTTLDAALSTIQFGAGSGDLFDGTGTVSVRFRA